MATKSRGSTNKANSGGKSGSGGKGTAGANKSGRAWKLERASITQRGAARPRSNKYTKTGDSDKKPAPGERTRAWVGGYTRADGKKVKGHYRELKPVR